MMTTDVRAVAAMALDEVQALIDQATKADVSLGVLFAALDRLTELSSAGAEDPGRVDDDAGGTGVAIVLS